MKNKPVNLNYILILFIIIFACIIYKKYKDQHITHISDINNNYNSKMIKNIKKPIMWIHIDYNYNARKWFSFGSRSSFELNQNYLYLTAKSIIEKNDKDFHIIICDDTIFKKIMPEWNINFSLLADPIKQYMRQLGFIKLIQSFGGIKVPISLLCFKSLYPLYQDTLYSNKPFFFENINHSTNGSSYTENVYKPNIDFFGSTPENKTIRELELFMQHKISTDYTTETQFIGSIENFILEKVEENKIDILDGNLIGIKDKNNTPILLDNLMGERYISFNNNSYGILIPEKEFLQRTKYEYFPRLSTDELLNSNSLICKYMIIANSKEGFEPIKSHQKKHHFINYWNGFWKTELTDSLYGPRPLGVSPMDRVPKSKFH